MTAIGIFLLFGTVMAFLAGTALVWPSTFLDRMWALNPRTYDELAPLGKPAGFLFLSLAVGAHPRWHRLAQAAAVGMAVGCGHYRN